MERGGEGVGRVEGGRGIRFATLNTVVRQNTTKMATYCFVVPVGLWCFWSLQLSEPLVTDDH